MCMIRVFTLDCYVLVEPGSTLSFVTPYMASIFDRTPESLLEPFDVSTPVGESIRAKRVYRACIFSIYHRDTIIDLIELDMTDFDLIFGIDWIYAYYASVDCRARTVKF